MTTPQLAAVLWDMDGTIIDSEPLWVVAETQMLERYGIAMTEQIAESLIGSGLWSAAEMFRSLGVPLTADEIVGQWVQTVSEGLNSSGPTWRPGALELLASLRDARVPCALVTMSTRAFVDCVLDYLPEGVFRTIVTGDRVQHEKPHPQPYLLGAEELGVPIEACLVLEDSPTGIRSGVDAGAMVVGVQHLVDLSATNAHAMWNTLEGVDAATLADAFERWRSLES